MSATFLHGKNTRVLFSNPVANASYDISQFFNDASISYSVDPNETTTFQNGGVKTYIPGLKEGTIALSGLYDGTSTGVDQIFSTAISNSGDQATLVFPAGGTSENEVCYMANAITTKYDLKSPVSGVVAIDAEVQADGGVWRGKGKYFTATGSGSTVALNNGSATINGGLLVIGVLALSGTLSLTFQHSSDGVTYVNATSTAITAVGTQVDTTLALPNPIRQYTRLNWTLTGTNPSANIFFGFARF
jgi:hypothetical protein